LGDLRGFEVAPFSVGPPGPRFGNPRTWGCYAQRAQYAADTLKLFAKEGQYGLAVTSHSYLHDVWRTK